MLCGMLLADGSSELPAVLSISLYSYIQVHPLIYSECLFSLDLGHG